MGCMHLPQVAESVVPDMTIETILLQAHNMLSLVAACWPDMHNEEIEIQGRWDGKKDLTEDIAGPQREVCSVPSGNSDIMGGGRGLQVRVIACV